MTAPTRRSRARPWPGASTRVLRQPNRGRFEARRAGIEAAARRVRAAARRAGDARPARPGLGRRARGGRGAGLERPLPDGQPRAPRSPASGTCSPTPPSPTTSTTLARPRSRSRTTTASRRGPATSSRPARGCSRRSPRSARATPTPASAPTTRTCCGRSPRATGSTSRREFASVYRNREALRPVPAPRHAPRDDLLRRLRPARARASSRPWSAAFPASLAGLALAAAPTRGRRLRRSPRLSAAGGRRSRWRGGARPARRCVRRCSSRRSPPPSPPGSGVARGWPLNAQARA